MNLKLTLAGIAGALALGACATETGYVPAAEGPYGFSESRIESNRFQVTFSGNALTDLETVERYLLYRAAELTSQNGYDYFIMVNRQTDEDSSYRGTGFDQRFAMQYYHPMWGWRYRNDPFFNNFDMREVSRYQAISEIVMGNGPKPGDVNAYNAEDVLMNLAPQIVRNPEL